MYTVNQGPSRLVAKTRTGLSQNYDKIESIRKIKVNNGQTTKVNATATSQITSSDNANSRDTDINMAKPVFQQYRRSNSNRSNGSYKNGIRIACFKDEEPQPAVSPQYEELIRYIHDSWMVLSADSEDTTGHQSNASSTERNSSVSSSDSARSHRNGFKSTKKAIFYHNDPPSPALQDFGAFDLESWWGRRLFNNITKSLWIYVTHPVKSLKFIQMNSTQANNFNRDDNRPPEGRAASIIQWILL